jgi:hypothetical protein
MRKARAQRVGLKSIRLHDARNTHATLMLVAGIHPKIISERLGHASISTTLDIYSHVLPGLQESAAEKFDRIFEGNVDGLKEVNVSKMLANGSHNVGGGGGIESGAEVSIGRTMRTFDLTFDLTI